MYIPNGIDLMKLLIISINLFICPIKIIGYVGNIDVLRAQCQAMCIKNFQIKNASECFKSCDEDLASCTSKCTSNHDKTKDLRCQMGCKFLKQIINNHGGYCKKSTTNTPYNSRCTDKCNTDSDCNDILKKCCQSGCRHYCMRPEYNASVPNIPSKLIPKLRGSNVEFNWANEYTNFVKNKEEPLVFILQVRSRSCKSIYGYGINEWKRLLTTYKVAAELEKFDPNMVYQFRLGVISSHGLRGYSPPSSEFSMKNRAPKIGMPQNLREVVTRINTLGKVQVSVKWDPPANDSTNIDEYTISWVVDHGYVQSDGQAMLALTQLTQTVLPPKSEYTIANMKRNTSYRISVYASYYSCESHRLINSEPVSLFIKTPKIQPNKETRNPYQSEDNLLDSKSKVKLKYKDLDFATVSIVKPSRNYTSVKLEIQEASNYFIVRWKPTICIKKRNRKDSYDSQEVQTKSNNILLNKLLYNCRYEIEIKFYISTSSRLYRFSSRIEYRGVFQDNSQQTVTGQFYIPSNHEMTQNTCYHFQNSLPIPRYLSTTSINANSLSYKLSWLPPEDMGYIQRMIKNCDQNRHNIYSFKYRIQWGPRINEPIQIRLYNDIERLEPILDYSLISEKIVEKDQHHIIVNNLTPNTMYIFRVQLVVLKRSGRDLESEMVSNYLYTGSEDLLFRDESLSNSVSTSYSNSSIILIIYTFYLLLFKLDLI